MAGIAALHMPMAEYMFWPNASSYASIGVSSKLPFGGPPALATTISG